MSRGHAEKLKKSKSQEIDQNLVFVSDKRTYRHKNLWSMLNWLNFKLYMPGHGFLPSRGHGFELWIHYVAFKWKQFKFVLFD